MCALVYFSGTGFSARLQELQLELLSHPWLYLIAEGGTANTHSTQMRCGRGSPPCHSVRLAYSELSN